MSDSDNDALRAAADGVQFWLREAQRASPDADPRRLVSVSPNVLGVGISLEGDDADDVPGAGTFTIITPFARRAAVALAEVAPQLLHVDEYGGLQPRLDAVGVELPYTPNYLDDVRWC